MPWGSHVTVFPHKIVAAPNGSTKQHINVMIGRIVAGPNRLTNTALTLRAGPSIVAAANRLTNAAFTLDTFLKLRQPYSTSVYNVSECQTKGLVSAPERSDLSLHSAATYKDRGFK